VTPQTLPEWIVTVVVVIALGVLAGLATGGEFLALAAAGTVGVLVGPSVARLLRLSRRR
jgi:hypothetical protein